MRIVILGAGTVGASIADLLCRRHHSITVVDSDSATVRRINEELDVRALSGSASQSSVLFQAGMLGADLCLAVTGDDEVNLVAASMAKAMGAHRSVARVYAPVFRDLSTFDYQRHFHIDRLVSLEHLVAMELAQGVRDIGSVIVGSFARGELEVQEVAITRETPATGVILRDLKLPPEVRIGSIWRAGRVTIAGAADTVNVGDRITLIGARDDIDEVKALFETEPPPRRSVVIAGGGETGYQLAGVLESRRFAVTLLEMNRDRCEFLAAHLKHATVVHADAQRQAVLEEERVGQADVFVACTGDDEDNIMACVEARELGAGQTMAIVSRPDYANVVGKLGIRPAVSPREVIAQQVLSFLNTGAVIARKPLSRGADVEVLEIEVLDGAPATERVLAELALPPKCLIAALIRESYVQVPRANDRLMPGDTVVTLVDQESLQPALQLFNVRES